MFALWSFLSLSLSFGRLSSFLVFDRAFAVGREEDERNAADGAERERERSLVVVVILVALLALLNAISMARKLGTKKCRTQQRAF